MIKYLEYLPGSEWKLMPRQTDLTGQRFGHLTVVEKTEKKVSSYRVWRCRCDCGNEILSDTRRLKRGTVSNCGCIPKTTARNGSHAEDLTGQVFGRLTVLYRVPNKKDRTRWMCRCSCGKEKEVNAHELKAGKTTSCGCKRQERAGNCLDLTGQRFGRLIALNPTDRRDGRGSVYWHCRCDCGRELDVTEAHLVHDHYRSCGCLKKEMQKNIQKQLHMVDGTCLEWLEKRKYRKDNTSGFRGVHQMKNGRYRVYIGFKKRRYNLGTYSGYNEAVAARLVAEEAVHQGFLDAYHTWENRAEEDPDWASLHPLIFDVEKMEDGLVIRTDPEVAQTG